MLVGLSASEFERGLGIDTAARVLIPSTVNYHAPYMEAFFAENMRPLMTLSNTYMVYPLARFRDVGNILDCVVATSLFKCTDPRDHLYSLLGVMSSVHPGLKADYALATEEVCTRFATELLVSDQNLKVLCIAPHTSIHIGDEALRRLDLPLVGARPDLIRHPGPAGVLRHPSAHLPRGRGRDEPDRRLSARQAAPSTRAHR